MFSASIMSFDSAFHSLIALNVFFLILVLHLGLKILNL